MEQNYFSGVSEFYVSGFGLTDYLARTITKLLSLIQRIEFTHINHLLIVGYKAQNLL